MSNSSLPVDLNEPDQLSFLCHEIRNPLNGVIGYSALLADTNLDSDQNELLQGIICSYNNILNILENFQFQNNDFKNNDQIGCLNLNKVASEVISTLKPKIFSSNFSFNFLSELDENLILKGSPVHFYQILLNLLSNAIKFTNSGFVELKICVESEDSNAIELKINVNDTGVGMNEKTLKNIFDPYFMAPENIKLNREGTGIGLAVVKNIIDKTNGEILVKSFYNIGTSFEINQKLEKYIPSRMIDSSLIEQRFVSTKNYSIKKILLVEDCEINRFLYLKILEANGFCVIAVDNISDAEKYLELFEFDLLISDFYLPGKNGRELIEFCMRKNGYRMKYILISGLDSISPEIFGVDILVLKKPIVREKLISVVNEILPMF